MRTTGPILEVLKIRLVPRKWNGAIFSIEVASMKKPNFVPRLLIPYCITFGFVLGISCINYLLLPYLGYRALGSLFLLCILVVSTSSSKGPIFFAALLSAVVWNFVFIPPTMTFAIQSSEDIMMVLSFFITAMIGGFLSETAQKAKMYKVSETLQETLLNSVSHELRTPITALIGTATALKDEKTFKDEVARSSLVDELVRSATRLDRVVENLLDISRFQRGPLQLHKEWFDVQELVAEVKISLEADAAGRDMPVSSTPSLLIEGDFMLLSHAVRQILLNAVKYSPPRSPIHIKISQDQVYTRIAVCDQGSGIPLGRETQIFEKFYRVPGTPTGGLGLGLAIAKTIIELHDGHITARRGEDVGSVFEIQLPAQRPPKILQEAVQ